MSDKLPEKRSFWKHFKGRVYMVLCSSVHTETGEICVVYEPMTSGPYDIPFHRPLRMWHEEVTKPDGTKVPRFTEIKE